jgi:predicted transcriptional regulator
VTLGEAEYAELTRLAAGLDLSAAWMIRRAVSEFIDR